MAESHQLRDIEEDQKLDQTVAERLAKVVEGLLNLE